MENYRWIKVNFYGNGEEISVRQSEADRSVFFDEYGHAYNIKELDFTQYPEEVNTLLESLKVSQDVHERTQNQLREMLAAMDAKSIADHQAEIDERVYWMKLRGKIFANILERGGSFTQESQLDWALRQTNRVFDTLYAQHQEFANKG